MTQMYAVTYAIFLAAITAARADLFALGRLWSNHIHVLNDIPDPSDVALMARFIVHNSNWTSVSYISHSNDTSGSPMAALFSVSDGPRHRGTGIPYFYVSRLQSAVTDLMDKDNHCSLMMSLAQSSICNDKNLDPEDPRCAHVVLTGTFEKVNASSHEYDTAKTAVFTRHPSFINLPKSHHFFIAKFNIQHIVLQDAFGGPSVVPVSDYFKVHDKKSSLAQMDSSSTSIKSNLLVLNLLLGLANLFS